MMIISIHVIVTTSSFIYWHWECSADCLIKDVTSTKCIQNSATWTTKLTNEMHFRRTVCLIVFLNFSDILRVEETEKDLMKKLAEFKKQDENGDENSEVLETSFDLGCSGTSTPLTVIAWAPYFQNFSVHVICVFLSIHVSSYRLYPTSVISSFSLSQTPTQELASFLTALFNHQTLESLHFPTNHFFLYLFLYVISPYFPCAFTHFYSPSCPTKSSQKNNQANWSEIK